MIFRVAVPGPFKQGLDYVSEKPLSPGVRVEVPLASRTLVGVVLAQSDGTDCDPNKLKPIAACLDEQRLFTEEQMSLYQWIAQYYHASIGDVIATALAKPLLEGKALQAQQQRFWQVTERGQDVPLARLKKSRLQAHALQLLQQSLFPIADSELRRLDISVRTLMALKKKALIDAVYQSKATVIHQHSMPALNLNAQQQHAVNAGINALGSFQTLLLDGVTGSGKTEVYIHIIEQVLAKDQQALVLVPEIGLTPQTLMRFRQRFAVPIVSLHSELNDTDILHNWALAHRAEARIVIGTRSSIFVPMPKLGLIILDEEHDSSFKQSTNLRYHGRDVAIMRAHFSNIPIILGTATPTLETLRNTYLHRYQHLELANRAGTAGQPTYHVIDMRQQPLQSGLSKPLIDAIKQHLAKNGQVILFLNRRGFAPVLVCHDCGWSHQCERCDTHYTVHQHPPHLCCHHCGQQKAVDQSCPRCHSSAIQTIGLGTEQIEATLQSLFSEQDVLRLDRTSMSKRGSLNQALEKIHRGQAKIIIGTQMLAKGHHFANVTMVGIVNLDGALFSCDFRAIEHMGQLLLQVAGRAGREERRGEVYLQTHQPEHAALQLLLEQGYSAFSQGLLSERQEALLPPFSYLALFRAEAKDKQCAKDFLSAIGRSLPQSDSLIILGPVPSVIARRANFYCFQLLLQSVTRQALHYAIEQALRGLDASLARKVRWSLDIDPQDVL